MSGDPLNVPPKRSEEPDSSKTRPTLWAHAYGGTQLAVGVLAGLFGGYWLDKKWGLFPWLTLAGAALGLVLGLYGFLKPFLLKKK